MVSTAAGAGEEVAGASVVAGARVAKKEDGSWEGETGAVDWVEGVMTAGVSMTDGGDIGDGVESAVLSVRVSMLTVLP